MIRFITAMLLCIWAAAPLSPSYGQDGEVDTSLTVGPETGLPLPRFVSISVEQARMRAKPSTEHTVLFIYLRVGLPMKVLAEEGDWRFVEDHDGTQGWMKNTVLSNDRTFRVMPAQTNLYTAVDEGGEIRAILEQGVVGTLRLCREDGWCRATAGNVNGWLRVDDLWGVAAGEAFN